MRGDNWAGLWYRRYRGAAYVFALGALVWTAAMVLPFAPFSDAPPILVGGGPGVWLLVGYVLFVAVGIGGFGAMTSFLVGVELHEKRSVDSRLMWPATALLVVGFVGSCVLLGVAGAVGGYDSTFQSASAQAIDGVLSPFVYPITSLVLITVIGAALAVVALVRARWPSD